MMIRTALERISKERDDWNSTINQLDPMRYGRNAPLKNNEHGLEGLGRRKMNNGETYLPHIKGQWKFSV